MFEQSLQKVLSHEGYYANVAGDNGGETYRGISRKFHPTWGGWTIVDAEKKANGGALPHKYKVKDARMEPLVAAFYKAIWDKIYMGMVKDESLQDIIFDAYINSGGNAIKLLQSTLNSGFGQNLKVDGAQGLATVTAINAVDSARLFNAYLAARENYYRSIATGSNAKFLAGWLNRLASFNYQAVGIGIAGIALLVGGFFLSNI